MYLLFRRISYDHISTSDDCNSNLPRTLLFSSSDSLCLRNETPPLSDEPKRKSRRPGGHKFETVVLYCTLYCRCLLYTSRCV